MSTSSATSGSESLSAYAVFLLGEAVAKFRYYVELNYAGASVADDSGGGAPAIPRVIDKSFGHVLECALRAADALPVVSVDIQALIAATRSAAARIGQVWLDADHRSRLRNRDSTAERADGVGDWYFDWLVLTGSPLAPPAWAEYQASVDRLQRNLPGVYEPLFRLSRLLAGICYPLPTDYDEALGTNPAFDTDRLMTEFGPQVAGLVRSVRAGSGLLEGVDESLRGRKPYDSAVTLHKAIRHQLAGGRGRSRGERVTQSGPKPAAPPASEVIPPVMTDSTAGSGVVMSTELGGDIADLKALKRRMDSKGEYLGESLAVLRLFRAMDNLNKLPDDPVMILGPTGAGKTRLAKLMHKSSARAGGEFIELSADDLVGGDDTIRRDNWAGHGRNSGLPGVNPKQEAEGWLQKAKGGTIFVDEFHDLDERSLTYLRKPLDRDREIPLAVGEGKPFIPDVRLIFATYRNFDELKKEGKVPPDVLRRLHNRFLYVPPLRDRKDDIPLFVEKLRGDSRPGECFYLALLRHDWEQGQVHELITTLKTVVAMKEKPGTLRASDLRGQIPDEVIDRVTAMTDADVGRELYSMLKSILETQGFRRRGRRGVALQKRLSELLGISKARVSTRAKELGLW